VFFFLFEKDYKYYSQIFEILETSNWALLTNLCTLNLNTFWLIALSYDSEFKARG